MKKQYLCKKSGIILIKSGIILTKKCYYPHKSAIILIKSAIILI